MSLEERVPAVFARMPKMGRQKKKLGHWPMARIIVNSDKKGLVRSVLLRMGERSGNDNSKRELERPIVKIVLIMGSDEV